ncbi:helix-turn-helix domain-containing protein [Bacillus tropicus]|uniref:helix-turn-helix domain-containing protein n=1 Tax=Bacillus tropicus TaxID=2026188 RepID=UPI002DBD7C62|nr:helix-turn-helix domain-containing protein [Bacillus tropicus]MEC2921448.1 helix-turn-helix domain-containing protein [Bacillus tropicus]MEC2926523.1 helix-turn-helix domain-containing protein [Bacillus tropicus]MEC2956116.1 helix-turn-helix domain-containing protein [Bacillus tropicus]MEC3051583.1 helix-turn-helix domain-containing protein [Bacillus tropicus]MEC3078018.1 helix-turn-helix domain-containing protein [Bacillus tropicus]
MNYLSFEEVCDRVGLTKNQLSYLIKYKQVEPVNSTTWKADGGYRFKEEDVEKLVEMYKGALTLKEAAGFLGKSKTYVHNAAKDGILPFKEIAKGKSTERLYLKKDLEVFKEKIENRPKKELKEKKQHLSLYLDEKVVEAIKKKAAKKGYNGYKKFAEDILSAEVKEEIEE